MTRNMLLGCLLAAATCNSMALSLGRAHGPAVLGQPLAMSFDVRLDAEDNVDSACISAEVVQGDTRIDPGRVRTSVTSSGQNAVVKVTTSVAIEEPVVSVVLKAGCTQNVSRRYVLLTELSPDLRVAPTTAAVASNAPLAPGALAPLTAPLSSEAAPARVQPRVAPATGVSAVARPSARLQRAVPSGKAQQRPVAQRKNTKTTKPVKGTSSSMAVAQPGKPRLQLEPATMPAAAGGGLKTSDDVPSSFAENPALRASASAQWRALNTQAQDITRQDTQEAELRSLRETAAKDKARVAGLTDQLRQAEQARYANGLVYALFALLLAALLALVYLWRRKPEEPPAWWLEQTAQDPSGDATAVKPNAPSVAAQAAAQHGNPVRDSGHAPLWVSGAHVDVDVGTLLPVATQPPRKRHRIHPEDLADVQQHADFFVSLGQYGQAIEVLRAYIGDHPTGSPVAYLDLLQIYQSLGRHADYQQLGYEFEKVFNATVPEPALFKQPGSGLEDYPDVLQKIEAVWGMPEVLELLEDMVRRRPEAQVGPFTLGAYRELLLLHAVAMAETDSVLMAPRLEVADQQSGWASNFGTLQQAGATLNPVPFTPTSPASISRHGSGGVRSASGPDDQASTYDLDIDLDLDLAHSAPDIRPRAPQVMNSNMVDFDLFDPDVEQGIAPKSNRR